MDTKSFVEEYRKAFGEAAPLPLIFYYSDSPTAETEKVPGCLLKYLHQAADGTPVCLSTDNITCGGGKFYTGFTPMPDYVPIFVSQKEKYKESPELISEYLQTNGPLPAGKRYLNFIRADRTESLDMMEGMLFIASPDVISGLCAWAFYDRNDADTVSLVFGSGCSSAISNTIRENRKDGYRCFVGLTDPSARIWFNENELSFAIPASRFRTMAGTMSKCCLNDTAGWGRIRERINKVRKAVPACADEMNCSATDRLRQIVDFCRLIDKEKFIRRRTYLTDGKRLENDAEHAWHLAVMALLLSEYSDRDIDLLKVVSIVLIHDLVEIYAGDTFAYDYDGIRTQKERETEAADRLFSLLPDDLAARFRGLWDEFEAGETPESKFAHTLDNFQPLMLQAATDGRAWKECGRKLSEVLKRNAGTHEGSEALWTFAKENFIRPQIEKGHLAADTELL